MIRLWQLVESHGATLRVEPWNNRYEASIRWPLDAKRDFCERALGDTPELALDALAHALREGW